MSGKEEPGVGKRKILDLKGTGWAEDLSRSRSSRVRRIPGPARGKIVLRRDFDVPLPKRLRKGFGETGC